MRSHSNNIAAIVLKNLKKSVHENLKATEEHLDGVVANVTDNLFKPVAVDNM